VSDYETAQRTRNIIVGIFVIVAMLALVWLIYQFGDLPVKVSEFNSFEVFVQFPTAQGVQKNTPVRFCGYQIGRVTEVMAPERLRDLNTGRPETKFLVDKMLLQGSTGMTSEFFPEESQKKLDELADSLDAFINSANSILGDEENRENIKTTLANLSDASKQTTQTLKGLQEFFAAGTNMSEELSKTLAGLRLILEKVNNGQGTAAQLVNDGRLYENLLENTQQMQSLLEELKALIAQYRKKGKITVF